MRGAGLVVRIQAIGHGDDLGGDAHGVLAGQPARHDGLAHFIDHDGLHGPLEFVGHLQSVVQRIACKRQAPVIHAGVQAPEQDRDQHVILHAWRGLQYRVDVVVKLGQHGALYLGAPLQALHILQAQAELVQLRQLHFVGRACGLAVRAGIGRLLCLLGRQYAQAVPLGW